MDIIRVLNNWKITEEWTLFLDRDGTINRRLMDDYVKSYHDFEFLPGVLEALPVFNQIFDLSIIVTNQQGVGKKLMTEKELRQIHVKMLEEITLSGAYIDEIYYCPNLASEEPECRKPNIGMALQALGDFPKIKFKKSVMVGDTISDMQFGKNLGMKTVLVNHMQKKLSDEIGSLVDLKLDDLATFAELLIKSKNNKS